MVKNKNGITILLFILIVMMCVILAAGLLNFVSSSHNFSAKILNSTRAFYFANAGIRRGLYEVKNNANPTGWELNWVFSGQTVIITITQPDPAKPDEYQINSSSTVNSYNKSLTALVLKDAVSNSVELLQWQEN
ncbi:MAG: hypothetical protein HY761_03350 [Candidatus Omnitrophica bacterium]|nr:hypothetical protein [Candidatus Omnitrophota bacterium]